MIVLGALAMVATLVGAIVAITDGINVCYINCRKLNQTFKECCGKMCKDIKKGELLMCLTITILYILLQRVCSRKYIIV